LPFGANTNSIPRAAEILANLMMQYGAEMTTPDHTQATFNLPEPNTNPPNFSAAEALDLYTSFANPNKANYTYSDKKDANGNRLFPMDIQSFMEGKSAMFIGYSYHIEYIKKTTPSLRFETSLLPQLRPENPVVLANYWGETVSKNCQYPNEAWDFIKFVTNNLPYYTNATQRIPALKAKLENYTGRQYYGPVVAQVDFSQSWYRKNTLKVEEIFSTMIDNVLGYNIPATTAVEVAARDINNLKE
jgi:ABC-type glycerol-3-phosphate transport system substrate-binding protein